MLVERFFALIPASVDRVLEAWERVGFASGFDAAAAVSKPKTQGPNSLSSTQMRGNAAIIHVAGPIFHHETRLSAYLGAPSVDALSLELNAAINDLRVKAIVLRVDSPGGELTGINELAGMISAAPKPVIAYVDGIAGSGAYWLASQATRIVADPTALLGSIGVVATVAAPAAGTFQIVSSQSPQKRVDASSESGRAPIQALVDDLAAEFIGAVAAGRGVSTDKVVKEFGQGGMMTGRRAAAAGMVDELGSLAGIFKSLEGQAQPMPPAIRNVANLINQGKEQQMNILREAELASRAAAVRREQRQAIADERVRIRAILAAEAAGRADLALRLAMETNCTVDMARTMLARNIDSVDDNSAIDGVLAFVPAHMKPRKPREESFATAEEELIASVARFANGPRSVA
jgi:ClpP class serine protease